MRSARVLLAVIGRRWLTATSLDGVIGAARRRLDDPSDWIRRELAEVFAAGVRVIPVLTEQAELPGAAELPADIAGLSRCQYRRLLYRDPTADLARIVADLTEGLRLVGSVAVMTSLQSFFWGCPTGGGGYRPLRLQRLGRAQRHLLVGGFRRRSVGTGSEVSLRQALRTASA
jgi:hypothetical protein